MYSGSLLFFHQASQVEKEESEAEGEKEIGDSQEPLNKFINFLLAKGLKKKKLGTISFLLPCSWKLATLLYPLF